MKENCYFTKMQIGIITIILGGVASLSHFAYEFTNENKFIGYFNPINESIWEHLKFMFFPLLIFWVLFYFKKRKTCNFSTGQILVSAATSLFLAPFFVVSLYYAYSSAIGTNILFIDISLVFICYFSALSVANHFLKYLKINKFMVILSAIVIIIIFGMFVLFTFNPPNIPLFAQPDTSAFMMIKNSH